jgi:Putative phage tail protein
MAQLIVGAVGAGIGFLIGGPTGAQVGWAIGSTVGGMLAAPDQQGPRLSERTVQLSSYGAAVPELWGGYRLAGNVIWSTDLIEASNTESAGKGGPDVTTYSYSVSCAVAICDGTIGSIRRIWADAKLVYDARADADTATQAASAAFAVFMTIYTGTEAQLPDATIEAAEGAGDVEAFRGTAYVVFTGLPLGDYGNRIPNFTFEVTSESAQSVASEEIVPYVVGDWAVSGDAPMHSTGDAVYDNISIDGVAGSIPGPFSSLADAIAAIQASKGEDWANVICWWDSANSVPNVFSNGADLALEDPHYCYIAIGPDPINNIYNQNDEAIATVGAFAALESPGSGPTSVSLSRYYLANYVFRKTYSTFAIGTPEHYPIINNHDTLHYSANYPTPYFPSIVAAIPAVIRVKRTPYIASQSCEAGDPAVLGVAQLPGAPTACISASGEITPNYQYTPDTGTFKALAEITYGTAELTSNGLTPVLRTTDPNYSSSTYWTAAATAAGVTGTYGVDYPVIVTDVGIGTVSADQVEAGSALLSAIVTDLCVSAGLTIGQIDVTALDDVVLGYVRPRVMSARAALEPLRQVYHFDAVESGDKIKFVKRGGASVATIQIDDLGARIDSAGEPIEHSRRQESELPAAVRVSYQSPTADFQVGVQQAQRRAGASAQVVQVELPLVLSDLEAAQTADVLLYEAWVSRTQRKISAARSYTRLEPTDVITIVDGGSSYVLRVMDKNEDGGVVELDCQDEDAATYSPDSTAGAVSGGGSAIRFDGPTKLYAMDIPLLRDADNSLGHYVGATGFRTEWRGARLFRSTDAGANYSALQDIDRRVTAGVSASALRDFDGGNLVDETNTVDVTLVNGTLSTITRAQLLNSGNAALLGDEIINFRTATLVSGTTYRLSGLLRGRLGTEDAQATHAIGERFVLLDAGSLLRQSTPASLVDVAVLLKAVGRGYSVDDAYTVSFTDTAISSKPLAPVHLFATRRDDGTYAAQWVRRTRFSAPWIDSTDAPLGEDVEAYRVRVLNGATVVEQQVVYTTAATFGDAGSPLINYTGYTLEVCQLSSTVGAGFAATATL